MNKISDLLSVLLLVFGIHFATAEVDIENQEFVITSDQCYENSDFYCSEEINSGEAFFSETSEANKLSKF